MTDMWGTMPRDVFSCIFRLLNLASKRTMMRVCKRFYWLTKPHLTITVVPNQGWCKLECACCVEYNRRNDGSLVIKHISDILPKKSLSDVPQLPRIECEYGHVFPCHAKDVTLYIGTKCPRWNCGYSIVMPLSKKKRKLKGPNDD